MAEIDLASMRRLTLGSAGVAAIAVNALLVWPLVGRWVDTSVMGTLAAQLAVSSILAAATSLGLNVWALRAHEFTPQSRDSLEALCARAATVSHAGVLVLAVAHAASDQLFLATAAAGLSQGAALTFQGLWRGLERLGLFAGLAVATQTVSFILSTGVAAVTNSAGWSMASFALATAAFTWCSGLALHPRGGSETREWRDHIAHSIGLVPGNLLFVAVPMGVRVAVFTFGGASQAFDFQYIAIVGTAAPTVVTAVSPLVLLGSAPRPVRMWQLTTLLLAGYGVFVLIVTDFWLPPSVDLDSTMLAISVLAICVPLQTISDRAAYLMIQAGRTLRVSLAMLLAAVASAIVFAACLQSTDVFWSGVWALLAASVVRACVLTVYARSSFDLTRTEAIWALAVTASALVLPAATLATR